jgi:putative oxidoreductase
MNKYIQVAGRVLLALIFVMAGIGKIQDPAGTMGYMQSMGVPGILLWPTAVLEILGGLAVAIGFQTCIAATALAVFTLAAAGIFHHNFADQMQMIMFLKNLSIAGGLLILASGAKR